MDTVSYILVNLTALVIGQFLVTRGHWSGFLVWGAANLYDGLVCVATGMPQTSCLFAAYLLVNACSLVAWLRRAAAPAKVGPAVRTGSTRRRAAVGEALGSSLKTSTRPARC